MNLARRRAKPMPTVRLPLLALIDVVLFLLLYFVMIGSLAGEEARLAATLAAQQRDAGRAGDLTSQIILVDAENGRTVFRFGPRLLATRDELVTLLRALPKEPGVVIKVADQAPIAAAAAAMQAARDAGFTRVSYVAPR